MQILGLILFIKLCIWAGKNDDAPFHFFPWRVVLQEALMGELVLYIFSSIVTIIVFKKLVSWASQYDDGSFFLGDDL